VVDDIFRYCTHEKTNNVAPRAAISLRFTFETLFQKYFGPSKIIIFQLKNPELKEKFTEKRT